MILASLSHCPAGHGRLVRHATNGAITCPKCTLIKHKMLERRARNARLGRNPRETLLQVPVEPLREYYTRLIEKDGMDASKVARAAGYLTRRRDRGGRTTEMGDIQRLKRTLGIAKCSGKKDPKTGRAKPYFNERVDYDTALLLCKAMGIEYPAEVGV